jgi:hypothetical protein
MAVQILLLIAGFVFLIAGASWLVDVYAAYMVFLFVNRVTKAWSGPVAPKLTERRGKRHDAITLWQVVSTRCPIPALPLRASVQKRGAGATRCDNPVHP